MPISEAILPACDDPLDVVGAYGQLEVVGVVLDHPVDQVDLLGDGARRVGVLAGDVDRPELGLDAPFAEPGDVGLAGVEPLREVELRQGDVAFGPQPPGQVVVAVEEHPRGVDLPGPLRDRRQVVGRPAKPRPRVGTAQVPEREQRTWNERLRVTVKRSPDASPWSMPDRSPAGSHVSWTLL